MRLKIAHITRHAAERAVERLGFSNLASATAMLRAMMEEAIHVPTRLLHAVTGREPPIRRKGAARFFLTRNVVFVVKGSHVVTVWPLTDAQLGELLARAA